MVRLDKCLHQLRVMQGLSKQWGRNYDGIAKAREVVLELSVGCEVPPLPLGREELERVSGAWGDVRGWGQWRRKVSAQEAWVRKQMSTTQREREAMHMTWMMRRRNMSRQVGKTKQYIDSILKRGGGWGGGGDSR